MVATKLIVNSKPSLQQKKRSQIRAQVFQLEMLQKNGAPRNEVIEAANEAAQQIGQLGRFHPVEAQRLKQRIQVVRSNVQ